MRPLLLLQKKTLVTTADTIPTATTLCVPCHRAMPPSVNIIEEARVAVPATAALPPEPIRLSALDAQWITLPLIQRVLIFVDDGDGNGSSLPPFASAVDALRASLAETLARFPTLAGRIVHVPATGDAAFDCGTAGGGGVRFLVAEASDDAADAARLAEDEEHDAEAFAQLVPALDTGVLPAETLAAQVTRLRGGGLAVGVAMHHAAVDGRSVWRFLRAWAAACRGEGDADAAAAEPPTFNRAAIRLPGGEELARSVLRKWTPDLPVVRMPACAFSVGRTCFLSSL
jgi:hypothetical protein